MYELIKVGENTFYIECPAKIGLYRRPDNRVYLIDSGNDKEAGRKVLKILKENEFELEAIINTHSNADHTGGNKFLQDRTGCKIYAKGLERAITEFPLLEPAFLYGGRPPKDLRGKFLMAQPSKALDISDESFPAELEVIPLQGHFFDMIGIKTPDNIAFIADCVTNENILSKYHIFAVYDAGDFFGALDRVTSMEAELFIPSHAEPVKDIKPLAELNRKKSLEIIEKILELCTSGLCFEDILKEIFDFYEITMDFSQNVLVGMTIKSYLSYLKDNGRMAVVFKENRLIWKTVENA